MAAMTHGGRVVCSSAVAPPPPRRPAKTSLPFRVKKPDQQPPKPSENPIFSKTPRRNVLLLLSFPLLVPSLSNCSSAAAFSLGISGPKEWLRDQKKKASKFLLAPIGASRENLRTAYLLLTSDLESPVEESGEVRKLLNSATRDCVPQDRNSFVAFQARTGVEVCTFSLIVKNAASLLDKSSPVKLEAEAMLGDLIRSFSDLGNMVDNSDLQLTSDRQKVKDGLTDTISTLDKFEQGIKACLGV